MLKCKLHVMFLNFPVMCQNISARLEHFRQFLTGFSTSDWFFAMLKISTEHGSVVPAGVSVGSCVSKTVNNIESIKRKVVLVIYRNSSATFAWACSKISEA